MGHGDDSALLLHGMGGVTIQGDLDEVTPYPWAELERGDLRAEASGWKSQSPSFKEGKKYRTGGVPRVPRKGPPGTHNP